MSEEVKKRGRQLGSTYTKEIGYISIRDGLRARIEVDCIILEERSGNGENEVWSGNNKYFTSWEGLLKFLVRRFTTEKISKKELWNFTDAKNEIIKSIKEVKEILIGEIEKQMVTASDEIKKSINKFNK